MFNSFQSPTTQLMTAQLRTFGQSPLYRAAAKSWAHYRGVAYDPVHGLGYDSPFADWDETINGKRPYVVPLGRIIIDSGAEFLFGEAPAWNIPASADLEALLHDILRANDLDAKLLPLARQSANDGSIWFKFA